MIDQMLIKAIKLSCFVNGCYKNTSKNIIYIPFVRGLVPRFRVKIVFVDMSSIVAMGVSLLDTTDTILNCIIEKSSTGFP
jgi:hypothetical protein